MRVYLFVYPIKAYTDELIMREFDRSPRPYPYHRLGELIDLRYRRKGYTVSWLFFSRADTPHEPDIEAISPLLSVSPGDRVLCAGVPFGREKNFHYADPDHVLMQLPGGTSELMLGGFHQGDCVDRLAAVAHQRGIPALIDEDTTQHFFAQLHLGHPIPDERDYRREGFGIWRNGPDDTGFLRCKIAAREGKSWLIIPEFVQSLL